jgi:hypothetical protein
VRIDAKRLSARVLVVVCLASVAGLAAWVATKGKTPIYERTVSFVVVPAPKSGGTTPPSTVDASIAGGIGSKAMLAGTLLKLGYPATAKGYSLQAFVRPGSDFIDSRLRGPDANVLSSLSRVYVRASQKWSADRYGSVYDLDFVETVPTAGLVSPHPKRTMGLAFVIGTLVGLLVLYAESQLAARRRGEGRTLVELADDDFEGGEREGDATRSQGDEEFVRQLGRQNRPSSRGTSSRRRRRRAGGHGR